MQVQLFFPPQGQPGTPSAERTQPPLLHSVHHSHPLSEVPYGMEDHVALSPQQDGKRGCHRDAEHTEIWNLWGERVFCGPMVGTCFQGVETSLLCKPQCLNLTNITSLGTGSS